MPRADGQEPSTPDRPDGYAPGERITAGFSALLLLFVGVILLDIASNGRLLSPFGGSPVDEAERITREAAAP